MYLVYSDGNPVYAIPARWKAPGADQIRHVHHDHNDPKNSFVSPTDREKHQQPAESQNSALKTTTLFPQRGAYEPHLSSVVQEFAFHRDDGLDKLNRYGTVVSCVY